MKHNWRILALLMALAMLLSPAALAKSGVIEFTDPSVSGKGDTGVFVYDAPEATQAPQTPQTPRESAPVADGVTIPTATLSPQVAQLPWNLMLVNYKNPVPDDWQVELKQLSNGQAVDARIYPELQAMFDACRADGLKCKVRTSYRTYEDQQDMLVVKYRRYRDDGLSHADAQAKALTVAAYPGYSEHQLGLAVDINTSDSEACSNSETWDWMKRHCHEYGFIWRYPGVKSDITGIANEDWHFRYVGVEAATYIMENELCLEEYLYQQYGIPY